MAAFGILIACIGALVVAGSAAESIVIGLFLGCPIALFGLLCVVLALIANRRPRRRHRKRVTALVEALGQAPPLSPIGDAEGRCRVKGRVHVLAFAAGADPNVAAKAVREVTSAKDGDLATAERNVEVTNLDEMRTCGRFAIVDDSGVAIVDPDDFEVISRESTGPFAPVVITAEKDEQVEVIGTGRRVPAIQLGAAADLFGQAGYREAARKVLLFEGADDPVLIVGSRR